MLGATTTVLRLEQMATYSGPFIEDLELAALDVFDTLIDTLTPSIEETASKTETETAGKITEKPASKKVGAVQRGLSGKKEQPSYAMLGWVPAVILALTVAGGLWAKARQLKREKTG